MNDNEKVTRKQAAAEARRLYKVMDTEWTLSEFIADYIAALEDDGYIID